MGVERAPGGHPTSRWLVLGPGGAGKTTLATELATRTGLPLVHLDRAYWLPGWRQPRREAWLRRVGELAAADAWVMDGNYSGTLDLRLERAQATVLMLPPVWTCLAGVLVRGARHRGRVRPDAAPGCPERLPAPGFLRWIATYRSRSLPRVRARLAEHPHVVVHELRSRAEARRWLDGAVLGVGR